MSRINTFYDTVIVLSALLELDKPPFTFIYSLSVYGNEQSEHSSKCLDLCFTEEIQ